MNAEKKQQSLNIEPVYLLGEFSSVSAGVGLSIFNGEHVIVGLPFNRLDDSFKPPEPSSDLLDDFLNADTPSRLLDFINRNGFLFPDRNVFHGTLYGPNLELLQSEYMTLSHLDIKTETKDSQKAIDTYGFEQDSKVWRYGSHLISIRDCLTAQAILLDVINAKRMLDSASDGMLPIACYEYCGFDKQSTEHTHSFTYQRWISGKFGEDEKASDFSIGKYYRFLRDSLPYGEGYLYLEGNEDSTTIYCNGSGPVLEEYPDRIGTGVLRYFIDVMMKIHLSSIRISTTGLAEYRASYSLISHIWYQLLDSFRDGRAGRCEYCGRPFITKGKERGTPRKYCTDRHRVADTRIRSKQLDESFKQDAYGMIDSGLTPTDVATKLREKYPNRKPNHFTIEGLIKERMQTKGGETK